MYEWGPITAKRKVVLIHGISGACPALLGCAERLVSEGCRVMMVELFGRGWSGGPADLPYDGRLYCSQLFMALASSDISWTGETAGRFTIVGYSLGGCIAVEFASWFPTLVEDLVLVAPAGLIRPTDPKTWLMYTDYLPERLTTQVVARRLRSGTHGAVRKSMSDQKNKPPEVEAAAAMPEKIPAINVKKVNSEALMQWQMKHNAGFLTAFIGSVRDSPTRCQHDLWQLLGHRINALRTARASSDESGISEAQQRSLASGKVLLCVGGRDPLIKPAELVPDAVRAIGPDNIEVKTFAGAGHEVGMSRGVEIAETAVEFWKRNSSGA